MAKPSRLLNEFAENVRRAQASLYNYARHTRSLEDSKARTAKTIRESRELLAKLDDQFKWR
jgi:hypothetical protein